MFEFQQGFKRLTERLGQVIQVTNSNTNLLETLAYKSIDHAVRSRRNNLIFWGLSKL